MRLLLLSLLPLCSVALECYDGYRLLATGSVGTTTTQCSGWGDYCYNMTASAGFIIDAVKGGCSTYRCLLARDRCIGTVFQGVPVSLCCCSGDRCNIGANRWQPPEDEDDDDDDESILQHPLIGIASGVASSLLSSPRREPRAPRLNPILAYILPGWLGSLLPGWLQQALLQPFMPMLNAIRDWAAARVYNFALYMEWIAIEKPEVCENPRIAEERKRQAKIEKAKAKQAERLEESKRKAEEYRKSLEKRKEETKVKIDQSKKEAEKKREEVKQKVEEYKKGVKENLEKRDKERKERYEEVKEKLDRKDKERKERHEEIKRDHERRLDEVKEKIERGREERKEKIERIREESRERVENFKKEMETKKEERERKREEKKERKEEIKPSWRNDERDDRRRG